MRLEGSHRACLANARSSTPIDRYVRWLSDLRRAPTVGSPALLLQLTTNLVHNAIVHNLPEQGTVWVTTSGDPKSVVLTVENTGEKLTPQLVSTLAEPFQRGTKRNLRIVDEVEAVASEADATPAQVALAWLLAQGDDIAPIPGTKRVSRVEENTAADQLELSDEQIERLNHLTPAAGERHEEAQMAVIDR
jgi:predicted oxidoreductase